MADLDIKQKHSRGEVMQFPLNPRLIIKERNGEVNNNNSSSVCTSFETAVGVQEQEWSGGTATQL
jgi:hypothetical protein